MLELPSERTLRALVALASVLVASFTVLLTTTWGDLLDPLFRHVLTGQALIAMIIWIISALAARSVLVGKPPKNQPSSSAASLWVGSQIVLFFAVLVVLVASIAALILGLVIATALVRALALLLVVSALIGIIGGAVFNSILVVRHFRSARNVR